jgi:hypothetical protein
MRMPMTQAALIAHLHTAGIVMAALVVVNLFVPSRLHWKEEMSRLSLVNRQIFQVHSGFLILTLSLLSVLLLTCARALVEPTRLSRAVLIGLTIFWAVRMLIQWGFYSSELWRGHRFNTVVHYVFSAIWIYLTSVFAVALWMSVR